MFKKGIDMKKIMELYRLHYDFGYSQRDIALMVNVSKTSVLNYIKLFEASGLKWPLAQQYIEDERLFLETLRPGLKNSSDNGGIDFAVIHRELKSHKHMTVKLLWEEMRLINEVTYSYEHFARLYKQWLNRQPNVMRQSYVAGERVFVDYSGDKVALYDESGNITSYAEIFVGVLGASGYIYLEATMNQKLANFCMSHVRMFEHFGGVPALVVPDNLRSGVKKSHRYDPTITPGYYQTLNYYGAAAMPTRVYKPKDKTKVENGVLIIQRWILARLRKTKCTSLSMLNQELHTMMAIANNKKLQRYPHTRLELFNQLDKPALKALPATAYVYRDYKKGRVANDYHVELHGHHYSVPYNLVKLEIDVWYSSNLVEFYYQGKCVAKHVRSYNTMQTTCIDHMPPGHKAYATSTAANLKEQAKSIGLATELIVEHIFNNSAHTAIACRKCCGFLRLANKYGNQQLEDICDYAINIGVYDYKNVQCLLERKIKPVLQHSNIRGATYYV
jgi:transposase